MPKTKKCANKKNVRARWLWLCVCERALTTMEPSIVSFALMKAARVFLSLPPPCARLAVGKKRTTRVRTLYVGCDATFGGKKIKNKMQSKTFFFMLFSFLSKARNDDARIFLWGSSYLSLGDRERRRSRVHAPARDSFTSRANLRRYPRFLSFRGGCARVRVFGCVDPFPWKEWITRGRNGYRDNFFLITKKFVKRCVCARVSKRTQLAYDPQS